MNASEIGPVSHYFWLGLKIDEYVGNVLFLLDLFLKDFVAISFLRCAFASNAGGIGGLFASK
jgi:hypothetical protein